MEVEKSFVAHPVYILVSIFRTFQFQIGFDRDLIKP